MNSSSHVVRGMPFLKLGRDVFAYNSMKHPQPFENKPLTDDADTTDTIMARITGTTIAIQRAIKSDAAYQVFSKSLRLKRGELARPELLQVIALVAYYDLTSCHCDASVYGIVSRVADSLSADMLEGRLAARKHFATLLTMGVLFLDGDTAHLCKPIIEWFVDGDMLRAGHISDRTVASVLASKAAASNAPSQNTVKEFVKKLPNMTPVEMDAALEELGYVAQSPARKVLTVSAYRHVQRLRRRYVDGVDPKTLPKRENVLCLGPTGSGKTHLISLLFGSVLKLPAVMVDITKFTETGYVGDEVESILTRLYLTAKGDMGIAQLGVACIDEIDKVAGTTKGRNSFGGAGSNKDVSGVGVQRGLLKLLEGSVVDIPKTVGDYRSERIRFNTSNVLFIGCGAFTGIEDARQNRPPIGFNECEMDEAHDSSADLRRDLFSFGMMREFLGRFSQCSVFDELKPDQLHRILEGATERYRNELQLEGIALEIGEPVMELVVDRAIQSRTGARALTADLASELTDAMYYAFSESANNRRIILSASNGRITWDIAKAPQSNAARQNEMASSAVPPEAVKTPVEMEKCHASP